MTGDEDNDNDDHNECSEGRVKYIADTFALCPLSSLVRKVDCPCWTDKLKHRKVGRVQPLPLRLPVSGFL